MPNYVINVAKKDGHRQDSYAHHFRVEIDEEERALRVFAELAGFYPRPTFKVEVARWNNSGYDVTHEFQSRIRHLPPT